MKKLFLIILGLLVVLWLSGVEGKDDKILEAQQRNIVIDQNVGKTPMPQNTTLKPIRIGIVGSGIGGSATAYYLHKIFSNPSITVESQSGQKQQSTTSNSQGQYPVEITVFEKDRIGGRARSAVVDNGNVELGASIIHPLNENLNNIVKELGLTRKNHEDSSTGENEIFRIWDGNGIVFTQSKYSFIDNIKMLVNYYWDPIRFKNCRDDVIKKFMLSYQRKEPFHTVDEFFSTFNITNTTKITAKEYFMNDVGMSEPFIQNILSAAIRVNYNQDYDNISAFASLIALVGSEDSLYSVKGGNYQMAEGMIRESKSNSIHAQVTKIEKIEPSSDKKHSNPVYKVSAKDPANPEIVNEHEFDFVVIATPLELTDINFSSNIDTDFPRRQYKEVNVYLVAAEGISTNFFGIPVTTNLQPPLHILTAYNKTLPFFCVSKNPRGVIDDGRTLFKIFAPNKLEASLLDQVFQNHTVYIHHPWKAYPVLTPTTRFPPIQIDKGIYYVNAFEHAVSTMETQTISAKNIARLIAKSIKRPYANI